MNTFLMRPLFAVVAGVFLLLSGVTQARWYSPETGGFISVAPYPPAVEHPYTFAGQNPVTMFDPRGEDFRNDCDKTVVVVCSDTGKKTGNPDVAVKPGTTFDGDADGVWVPCDEGGKFYPLPGYYGDDWVIRANYSVWEEDILFDNPAPPPYDPTKDSGNPVKGDTSCSQPGYHRSPAWRSGGTRKNGDGTDNNSPPDWSIY